MLDLRLHEHSSFQICDVKSFQTMLQWKGKTGSKPTQETNGLLVYVSAQLVFSSDFPRYCKNSHSNDSFSQGYHGQNSTKKKTNHDRTKKVFKCIFLEK